MAHNAVSSHLSVLLLVLVDRLGDDGQLLVGIALGEIFLHDLFIVGQCFYGEKTPAKDDSSPDNGQQRMLKASVSLPFFVFSLIITEMFIGI